VRLLLLPAVVVLAVFAAALGALFRWSVLEFIPGSLQTGGLTVANFRAVLAPQYLGAVRDTIVLSALTTVLTLVCAYPVAYALARASSRWVRSLILVLTLAPFFTGAIVRTYAWVLVLGNTVITWPVPMLFTERGVLVGLVHFSMPTMILILAAALSHIDPVYERAAASLGAPPWRVFRRVTLPLSMPGIVAGSLLTFIPAAGDYVNSALLGTASTAMIGNVIDSRFFRVVDYPTAAALSVLLMAAILLLVAAYVRRSGTDDLL
jgi:ABC-type spermidine/putrescine transport system permease subunit I